MDFGTTAEQGSLVQPPWHTGTLHVQQPAASDRPNNQTNLCMERVQGWGPGGCQACRLADRADNMHGAETDHEGALLGFDIRI